MKIATYKEAVSYLESDLFIRPSDFESATTNKNPLERFRYFLELLKNPQNSFKSIVVSGTSGKGSTTTMIASILSKSGYKTGMTISPHLEKITERLAINNVQISEEKFITLINDLLPYIEQMKDSIFGYPSYFEILLASAFLYFAQEYIDIAVVEVGIEGKYDGSNLLNPLAFVLTNISLDHTAILGNSVEKIAQEATDRISYLPKNAFVVSGVSQSTIQKLIVSQAQKSLTHVYFLHKDFNSSNIQKIENGNIFSFSSQQYFIQNITLSLIGDYQIENASLAIQVVLHLKKFGFAISENNIKQSLSDIVIFGRFEIQKYKGQKIVFDGAHNVAKMNAFLHEVKEIFSKEKKVFLVSFSTGHNAKDMLTKIAQIADEIVITQFDATTDLGKHRMLPVETIASFIHSSHVYEEKNIKGAVTKTLFIAKKEQAIIFVTGSIFLIGQIKELLR